MKSRFVGSVIVRDLINPYARRYMTISQMSMGASIGQLQKLSAVTKGGSGSGMLSREPISDST